MELRRTIRIQSGREQRTAAFAHLYHRPTTMKRPTATRPASSPRSAQPALRLAAPAPRNPVAPALAARRASGAAGRHGPQAGARRAAERAALLRQLRAQDRD